MKKTILISFILIIILSMFNVVYGTSKDLKAKFKESDVSGTDFKSISITPYYSNVEDDAEKAYTIYLPSGYVVKDKTATYVADRNGKYPFTVYDGNKSQTFVYTVKNIEDSSKDEDKDKDKDDERKNISFQYKLMYDYEKKQVFFNMNIDKIRKVTTPLNITSNTNEVNYYIKELKNNVPYDFNITIDKETYKYKVIKSGEFYLLIYISPVNYNDYSTVVEYQGYNFTNNDYYNTYPSKDIYDDNGSYQVLVKSNTSQNVFNFNITGIDYRRPSVDIGLLVDDTFSLDIEDDFGLAYIITFDGQYVPAKGTEFTYNHNKEILYSGEYIFTVVDLAGNRTVETVEVKSRNRMRPKAMNLDVHNSKDIADLFKNKGIEFKRSKDDNSKVFENILPAYMNGKGPDNFNPDSPISRAEMVTIFCRLNNLPYDATAHLKSKFIDIENHWAKDYISMGSNKKYVSGYKDKTFKPDNNVTRAEFCQMLTKISSYKTLLNSLPASSNINYTDISNHWAEKEIIKIAGRNLIGVDSELFYPDKPITRGEVVHAINMMYGLNPSYIELAYITTLYDKYYDFKDIENHEFYYDIIISVVGMFREKIDN